jgi:hypothetical protein
VSKAVGRASLGLGACPVASYALRFASASLPPRGRLKAHAELANHFPCARRAGGVDGVRFGLGCNATRRHDQNSGFEGAPSGEHVGSPARLGREAATPSSSDDPRDPTALARTRENY